MRTIYSVPSLLAVVMALSSCGMPSVTTGDLKTLKLRDLNPWGGPRVVQVDEESLKRGDRDYVAYYKVRRGGLGRGSMLGPVDYDPPQLPDNAGIRDGSLLPPKEGGGETAASADGSAPGTPPRQPAGLAPEGQEFSIE